MKPEGSLKYLDPRFFDFDCFQVRRTGGSWILIVFPNTQTWRFFDSAIFSFKYLELTVILKSNTRPTPVFTTVPVWVL
jgi:hypothetical protein